MIERVGRFSRRLAASLAIAAAIVGAAACEATIATEVNNSRASASQPALTRDALLDAAARTKSVEMCDAGSATPTADPFERYDAETAGAVDELVGSAVLDLGTADGAQRNNDATDEIWDGWAADPSIDDARWDAMGVGETMCDDGNLYLTLVLRDAPTMPATGLYSSPQHALAEVLSSTGLVYGTAVNHLGQTQNLLLDVHRPPAGPITSRPTVVLVHGGGFSGGSRGDFTATAKEYARRGFVAVSIDYRLQPNSTPAEQFTAATNAIDDGFESVRWLKANAAAYGIDTTRIAMLGSSAGGAIAIGVGNGTDPTPGGPLAAISPTISAAVSTGAHLTPAVALIAWEPTDAPSLLYHYENDSVTGATDGYAFETCQAIRDAGNTCDFVIQTGTGHTTTLGAGTTNWTAKIGPFLWTHLRLHP